MCRATYYYTVKQAFKNISFTTDNDTDKAVRLAGGKWSGEGRVEIFHYGAWGTVCDDGWDINDARVVCHQLGLLDALGAPGSARFGEGNGSIWLGGVQCLGNESSIKDCQHGGWNNNNCFHSQDASVICSSKYHLLSVTK